MTAPRMSWLARSAAVLPRDAYARVPLACCLAGAVLLALAAGPTLASAAAGLALLAGGWLAGRSLAQRHAAAVSAVHAQAQDQVERVTDLCAEAAPVWIRQIETVRGEGDHEVGELARAFGDLCQKLDRVLGPRGGAPEEILAGLERNGQALDGLVASLRELQASKDRIVHEIGTQAAQLKESAGEIRQIALNIRMVSLNATIEAARAGAAGKPFGVIVADMRELAARTAEASDLFSRHTDRLHRTLGAVFDGQDEADAPGVSIATAEHLVRHVVDSSDTMMRRLTEAVAAMEDERRKVREDISRALVALQFQDRVSQILSHVTHNLEEMQGRIRAGCWNSLDERQWLERLATHYSTHEEFHNHRAAPLTAAQPGSAVTFF